MSILDLAANSLVHVAALLSVAAMFFRSQLKLRAFLLAGTVMNAIYFFVVPPEVLWGPVFWSAVMFGVNGVTIGLIVLDRTMFGLSAEEVALHKAFQAFSPGEYRRLMRLAAWRDATQTTLLTVRGAPVAELYYVLAGDIRVAKSGPGFTIAARTFIGEVAFLRGVPASASVTVAPGTRYVAWNRAELMRLIQRRPAIGVALSTLLNADLAAKVAAEAPAAEPGLRAVA